MKRFEMNITIQVEANSPEEAYNLLLNPKSIEAITLAIEANKENIKEIYEETSELKIIN